MRKTAVVCLFFFGAGSFAADAQSRLENFFVAPGKYVLYDCPQLATAEARFSERDKELRRLMTRAKEGPAGGLVSVMVYEPEYYSNLGELHDVQREQREKNCGPGSRSGLTRPASKPRR